MGAFRKERYLLLCANICPICGGDTKIIPMQIIDGMTKENILCKTCEFKYVAVTFFKSSKADILIAMINESDILRALKEKFEVGIDGKVRN